MCSVLQVPHSSVAIGMVHGEVSPNHILYTVNASLVGLCCLSEKVAGTGGPVVLSQTPICQCVGLGGNQHYLGRVIEIHWEKDINVSCKLTLLLF